MGAAPDLSNWNDRLRALPFVKKVRTRKRPDGELQLDLLTAEGEHQYRLAIANVQPLGYAPLQRLFALARTTKPLQRWMLFAPHISKGIAEHLQSLRIDYMDVAGNCHIDLDAKYFANVEGRKPDRQNRSVKPRTATGSLLFLLAAAPELANKSVRELAESAGAGKTAIAQALARLTDEGILAETRSGRRVARHEQLFDRFISAYPDMRRRWSLGRFRIQSPALEELESRIEFALGDSTWAWGGGAAVMRMNRFYRGDDTVLHVAAASPSLPKRLGAVADRTGPVTILVTPIPFAFQNDIPHVAHPLLVYAELLHSSDERARSAAANLFERTLERGK